MFNDNNWILDHPAYWSSGHWWNYPIAYEQQNWMEHPYHAHRRRVEEHKNNEIEVPADPTKTVDNRMFKTLPQRNTEMSPSKKRTQATAKHTYSPEKRRPYKYDELLDEKRAKGGVVVDDKPVPLTVVTAKEEDVVEMDLIKYTLKPGDVSEENKRGL